MTEAQVRDGELPTHIEETVDSIAKMHAAHRDGASGYDRLLARALALVGGPRYIGALLLATAAWIAFNLICAAAGRAPVDPPPFVWLANVIALLSLLLVSAIVAGQRREDEIARQRELLTLQLAILGEQKTAKVIALFEEFRRDSPDIRDRVDPRAEELAQSASPQVVLEAINQSQKSD